MKNKTNILLLAIIFTLSVISISYYRYWFNSVKQEVTEGNFNKYETHYFRMRSLDGNLGDSIGYAVRVYKPYCLETTYRNETVTDYGEFEEIEKIKCIRFNEMVGNMKRIDSVEIAEEIAEETAIELAEERLKQLNKPCK